MTSVPTASRLILASSSPARRKLLEDSGIIYEVIASDIDEDAVLARVQQEAYAAGLGDITPAQTALLLAKAKAQNVAARADAARALVLGCDSVFELNGTAYGKPHSAKRALERIAAMSGGSGQLHTGHWLVDTRVSGRQASELRTATVCFESLTEQEIEAYVATGEPLHVAGSFTVDGYGAAFIREIQGEYHTVVGLSIHALRSMLASLGEPIFTFWKKPS